MKNLHWIDFLKLRGQAGILGYEPYGTQFYWESYYNYASGMTYGPYTTNQWFGSETFSSTSSNAVRIANDGLGWEKNKEISFGFDAMLGKRWTLGYTHYNTLQDGIIACDTIQQFAQIDEMRLLPDEKRTYVGRCLGCRRVSHLHPSCSVKSLTTCNLTCHRQSILVPWQRACQHLGMSPECEVSLMPPYHLEMELAEP